MSDSAVLAAVEEAGRRYLPRRARAGTPSRAPVLALCRMYGPAFAGDKANGQRARACASCSRSCSLSAWRRGSSPVGHVLHGLHASDGGEQRGWGA